MNKRPYEEANGSGHPHKKHKGHSNDRPYSRDRPHHENRRQHDYQRRDDRSHHGRNRHQNDQHPPRDQRAPPASTAPKSYLSHEEALAKLPPPTSESNHVPGYIPFTVPAGLPDAPEITDPKLKGAPFQHRSATISNRSTETVEHTSYERLELLGDAYLELFASRLIFTRLAHLTAGRMSQIRELLVKNETLAEYAQAYGFEKRVSTADMQHMQKELKQNVIKSNKGFNKILGDVFEAYVAAVVLSDLENGFSTAEKWLTALWAPKLQYALEHDSAFVPNSLLHAQDEDPKKRYDPNAKNALQMRVRTKNNGVKLEYEEYAKMQELKGDLLGQNRWFIGVYLTGEGYQKKLLGKGEGRNKVEAGNWAAIDAMYGESNELVEEIAKKVEKEKAAKREEERAAKLAEQEQRHGEEEPAKQVDTA